MKKIFIVLMCIFTVFMTGCSIFGGNEEKKLTCTKDISESGIPMLQTANVKFIGNKIHDLDTDILVTLPDEYKSYMDVFLKNLEEKYQEAYGENEHIKVTTTQKSDSEILVHIVFDFRNMTEKEKEETGFSGSEDYAINKATLENDGYTCK